MNHRELFSLALCLIVVAVGCDHYQYPITTSNLKYNTYHSYSIHSQQYGAGISSSQRRSGRNVFAVSVLPVHDDDDDESQWNCCRRQQILDVVLVVYFGE
jgi:hypothetical protein